MGAMAGIAGAGVDPVVDETFVVDFLRENKGICQVSNDGDGELEFASWKIPNKARN